MNTCIHTTVKLRKMFEKCCGHHYNQQQQQNQHLEKLVV